MYTYYAQSISDMMAITSYLLRHSIGFRAFYDHGDSHWVIELTGAH